MDDAAYGTRNKRGDWSPNDPLETAPILVWPPRPQAVLAWLPGYFLPWNVLFMALGALLWFALTPSRETMMSLSVGWVAFILLRNMAVVLLVYGALELRLYARRRQANRFKYNGRWPSESSGEAFLFKSEIRDNTLRTFGSGIPIWTAYEVGMLWAWANGWGPWITFAEHPVWLIVFALVLPAIHEVHFYCIHRLIHTPVLYRWIHSVHHNSVNPSPWSSLSMHPVEHLLYWSGALIHLILPSHPLLLLYHLQITGTGAVVGHIGFDKIEAGDRTIDTHAYGHYLHHKYFEVNYSEGTVPLDRWFGTWHDGTKTGDALMEVRLDQLRAKANAKSVPRR